MSIFIDNEDIVKLYTTGKSKKYKNLEENIINKFFKAVSILDSANSPYDLWNSPAFRFEKLKGKENKYSMRLNNKWRLEMMVEWTTQEKNKIDKIIITDISNHYGD